MRSVTAPKRADRSTAPGEWPVFGGDELDATDVARLVDFVNARLNLADHKLLLLLKTLFECDLELDAETRESIVRAALGFRYSLLDPGTDSMITWTEPHQLTFAVAEYLAGQLFPDETFTVDQRLGERKQRSAAARLDVWMSDRFRYGFSDWLSGVSQQIEAAALAMLIDYADDEALVTRAAMVLDLIMLDAALHSFNGVYAASAGRITSEVARHAETSPFSRVWNSAFGTGHQGTCDYDDIGALFCSRKTYEVPRAIAEIAERAKVRRVRTSQGLDLDEVARELARDPRHARSSKLDLLRMHGVMNALTTPGTISASLDAYDDLGLDKHRAFAPMAQFTKVPKLARKTVFNALNPIVAGMALQRANVTTFATRNYQLSSVQRYHPGTFGDQQHVWQARLPGNISVYGNHPGTTTLNIESRAPSPDYWVGNGILPDVAQHDNVLLAISDLRGRKGHYEGKRHDLVHFYFPALLFDETRFGVRWVAGRSNNSYLAIIGTDPLEPVSDVEVIQRGQVTGYAIVLADDEEVTSMADFVRQVKAHMLTLRGNKLSLVNPYGRYELTWGGDFVVGGHKVVTEHARYESHWVNAPRFPSRIEVRGSAHTLELDWGNVTRHQERRPGGK